MDSICQSFSNLDTITENSEGGDRSVIINRSVTREYTAIFNSTQASSQNHPPPASSMSFLEAELDVQSNDPCKCERFAALIKEYSTIREQQLGVADTNLQDLVVELTDQRDEAKEQIEHLRKLNEFAQKDINDYEYALNEEKYRTKELIAEVQKDNYALLEEIEGLKVALASKDSESMNEEGSAPSEKLELYDATLKKLEEAENLCNQLREENTSLKNDVAIVDVLKMELAGLKEKLDELVKKSDDALDLSNELHAENSSLKNEVAALNRNLDDALKHLEESKALGEQLLSENAYLTNEVGIDDVLKHEIAVMKNNLDTYGQKLDDALIKCKESDVLCAQLLAENLSLKVDNKAALDCLKDDLMVSSQKLEDALAEVKESEARCAQLLAENSSMKNELGAVDDLKRELATMKDDLDACMGKLDDALNKIQEAEDRCNQLRDENSSLKNELGMMEERVASIKLEDDVIQKAQLYDELLNEKAAKIKVFNEMKSENSKLKDEKAELQSLYSLKEVELLELKDTSGKDREELEKLQETREKLVQEIDSLNEQLEAADNAQKESSEQLFRLSEKLAKMKPDGNTTIKAAIDLGNITPSLQADQDGSLQAADGDETLQVTPRKDDADVRKRKESFGSKFASPFRRKKERSTQHNNSSCNQQ